MAGLANPNIMLKFTLTSRCIASYSKKSLCTPTNPLDDFFDPKCTSEIIYNGCLLNPPTSIIARIRGIVCVAPSIDSISNRRPRLESYRVSDWENSEFVYSCSYLFFRWNHITKSYCKESDILKIQGGTKIPPFYPAKHTGCCSSKQYVY